MKKMRVVLIGYGNMGKSWCGVLDKKYMVDIVGVVDVVEPNRIQARTDLNLADDQVSDDLEGLLMRMQPDFVVDCSAPSAHQANTTTALKHGCHILGEKPIALKLADAKEIVESARKRRVIYMINQNYRWRPILKVLKEYLESGTLGEILGINVLYAQSFAINDTFRRRINSPFLTDMAVHHFDVVRSLTGANFKTVYCIESNPASSSFRNGSSASAVFTLTNGVVFTYQGSWSEIGQSTSFMGLWRIACERGTVVWDGSGNPQVEQLKNNELVKKELSLPSSFIHKSDDIFLHELETSLDCFLDALHNKTIPETWCGDNIHTLDMVLSAIASSRSRRIVKVGYLLDVEGEE